MLRIYPPLSLSQVSRYCMQKEHGINNTEHHHQHPTDTNTEMQAAAAAAVWQFLVALVYLLGNKVKVLFLIYRSSVRELEQLGGMRDERSRTPWSATWTDKWCCGACVHTSPRTAISDTYFALVNAMVNDYNGDHGMTSIFLIFDYIAISEV